MKTYIIKSKPTNTVRLYKTTVQANSFKQAMQQVTTDYPNHCIKSATRLSHV